MKKIMMTVTMILTLVVNVFAGPGKISEHIVDAFRKEFSGARDVAWQTAGNNKYEVSFEYNGSRYFAYYNGKAQLLGAMRHILSTELPYYLQKDLKKEYAGYWIADLYEITNDAGTSYYVTLQGGGDRIVLESRDQDNWYLFSKHIAS